MTTTSYLALLMATSAKFVQPQLSNANETEIDSESSCIVVSRSLINSKWGLIFSIFSSTERGEWLGWRTKQNYFFNCLLEANLKFPVSGGG